MSAAEEKMRVSGDTPRNAPSVLPTVNPAADTAQPSIPRYHPVFYVVSWIFFSSSVILFNKYILDNLRFHYPVILTTWHLGFATFATQLLARWSTLLDGRKQIKMTGRLYLRVVCPIGVCFSISLMCGNMSYLYLSVAFIQMLKATTPVAVLLTTWVLGIAQPNLRQFLNVSVIVTGVIIATFGEIDFVFIGFIFQMGGIVFEAIRLTLVQGLLTSKDFKMDPLVSLYYFAPICFAMNGLVALFWEFPKVTLAEFANVGLPIFLFNGFCAFMLNVSVVLLIQRTSAVVLTLCGLLKDIILVVSSLIVFRTTITRLQFFGYSIALLGMLYYKLGYDRIKVHMAEFSRRWAEFGARKPILRKLSVIVFVFLALALLLSGLAPSYAPEYNPSKVIADVTNKMGQTDVQSKMVDTN